VTDAVDFVVVDASSAVAAGLSAEFHVLERFGRLVGPPLLWSESTSILRELSFRGEVTDAQARSAVHRIGLAPLEPMVPSGHYAASLVAASRLGWAKTYDAEYLALAQALDAPLLTLDERLIRGAGHLVRILRPTEIERS
jgi:predicted nucleic acid-binding protein